MKKLIALLIVSSFTLSAFAADPILTCTIKNPKTKKSASASLNLNKIASNGAQSEGVDAGKDNYNFDLSVEKVKKTYEISVTFYENNNVQDEVGGMSCVYKSSIGSKVFCEEPLTNDNDKTVAVFSCIVK